MQVSKLRTIVACALIVASAVSGCALYGRCGIRGCPGDAATSADVRSLLRKQPAFGAASAIEVQTYDHVVYLYGLVDTGYERRLATSIALEASGVARVVNLVGVSNGGR